MPLNLPLILFSILDFLAAFFLVWAFPGNVMMWVSILLMLKGVYSITTSMANGFYADFLGGIDLIGGLFLIIINFGTDISFAWILGVIVAGKAIYTLINSI